MCLHRPLRPIANKRLFTQSQLDLHLYYRENYAYQEIKKWTNITTTDESFTVTVDSSWFPTSSSTNVTWTMFGYYLPAGMNDTQQLVDVYSMYPRPFNFSVIRELFPGQQFFFLLLFC